MPSATLVRCACEHCSCSFSDDQGFNLNGQLFCSEACATHDHDHPSSCCQDSGCCS